MGEAWFAKTDSFATLALSEELAEDIAQLEASLGGLSPSFEVIRVVLPADLLGTDQVPGLLVPASVGDGCFDLMFVLSEEEELASIGRMPCVYHVHGDMEWAQRFQTVNEREPDDSWRIGLVAWAADIVDGRRLLVDVYPDRQQWGDRMVRYGAIDSELSAEAIWSACETAIEHDATDVRFAFFDGSYDRTVSAISPEPVIQELGL